MTISCRFGGFREISGGIGICKLLFGICHFFLLTFLEIVPEIKLGGLNGWIVVQQEEDEKDQ